MAYLTQSDLESAVPVDVLCRFLDDNRDGLLDTDPVTLLLENVDAHIDLHISPRYTIDSLKADVPDTLRYLAIMIATKLLYDRRLEFDIPKSVMDKFEFANKTLTSIREGKFRADINGDPISPSPIGTLIKPTNANLLTYEEGWKDQLPYSGFLT